MGVCSITLDSPRNARNCKNKERREEQCDANERKEEETGMKEMSGYTNILCAAEKNNVFLLVLRFWSSVASSGLAWSACLSVLVDVAVGGA
jgi:hypothetical protein